MFGLLFGDKDPYTVTVQDFKEAAKKAMLMQPDCHKWTFGEYDGHLYHLGLSKPFLIVYSASVTARLKTMTWPMCSIMRKSPMHDSLRMI